MMSVALPAISSGIPHSTFRVFIETLKLGIYQYPNNLIAEHTLDEVLQFCERNKDKLPKEIQFTNQEEELGWICFPS
jgi:hypothetical protein